MDIEPENAQSLRKYPPPNFVLAVWHPMSQPDFPEPTFNPLWTHINMLGFLFQVAAYDIILPLHLDRFSQQERERDTAHYFDVDAVPEDAPPRCVRFS